MCFTRNSLLSYLRLETLAVLFALGFHGFSSAATINIEPVMYGNNTIDVSIRVDGQERCRIKSKNVEGIPAKNSPCRFSISTTDKSMVVTGKYSSQDSETGRPKILKGEQTFEMVDLEPTTSQLRRSGTPFGQRVKNFMASAQLFAIAHKVESIDMHGEKPASAKEIDAAQKRLGYPLPPELVSILTTVGPIQIGDHSMTSAATLADSYTTMLRDWGGNESDLADNYSPKKLEFLKTSTLLFTELGDGMGGLLYRPPPSASCGDEGIYVWTSQENGSWSLSKNGACPNFERVFRWLLDQFVIGDLADEIEARDGAVVIDTSTGTQYLELGTENDETFQLSLKRDWRKSNIENERPTDTQGKSK